MTWENLDEKERAAILRLLRDAVRSDPFPLSPRLKPLKSALTKLDPASAPAASPATPQAEPIGTAEEGAAAAGSPPHLIVPGWLVVFISSTVAIALVVALVLSASGLFNWL